MFKLFIYCFLFLLPWKLRRLFLCKFLGYKISKNAYIGYSLVFPINLEMESNSVIGHFTVAKGLSLLKLAPNSRIGNFNWITGFPLSNKNHFQHNLYRAPDLIIGESSAITSRHIIDCTARVEIGRFSTFAGFRSQILTHSIDLNLSRQSSAPVKIGDYCFIGTSVTILSGSVLPNYSVLGAKAMLSDKFDEEYTLYAGVPAKKVKTLEKDIAYFKRPKGFVS